MSSSSNSVPTEFSKVIGDFIEDVSGTFPEYNALMKKWWKRKEDMKVNDGESLEDLFSKRKEADILFLYKFCSKKYPPRFFEILNQDESIFDDESEVDTEFLPFIHFKNLWQDDISDDTRSTIWKYLQLILFSVVNNVDDKSVFGETAKVFENMKEEDLKEKLDTALDEIKGIFENKKRDEGDEEQNTNIPQHNAEDIHNHLSGMFSGKLGELAREIAEETAGEINLDTDGETDVKGVFNKMFRDPGKLMGLVQNVGGKLEEKMKNGDINEGELMKEASEMMSKMRDIPGMGDMQSMLSKLGLNTGGAKFDTKGMEQRMKQEMRKNAARDRVKKMAQYKKEQKEKERREVVTATPKYTDEEIIAMMEEHVPKETELSSKKKSKKSKKKKKSDVPSIEAV